MTHLQLHTTTLPYRVIILAFVILSFGIAFFDLFTQIKVAPYLFYGCLIFSSSLWMASLFIEIIQVDIQDNVLYYRKGNIWSGFKHFRSREHVIPIQVINSVKYKQRSIILKTKNDKYTLNLNTWSATKRKLLLTTIQTLLVNYGKNIT